MLGMGLRILGGLIKIVGNTTGIPIGNVLDALKVNLRDSSGAELGTPANPIYTEFPDNANRVQENTYAQVSAPTGVNTTITSYTVPGGVEAVLERVAVSGENIAEFTVLVNSIVIETKRTYFGGKLNATFDFTSKASLGYNLDPADVVEVKVLHNRGGSANFEARIQTVPTN